MTSLTTGSGRNLSVLTVLVPDNRSLLSMNLTRVTRGHWLDCGKKD